MRHVLAFCCLLAMLLLPLAIGNSPSTVEASNDLPRVHQELSQPSQERSEQPTAGGIFVTGHDPDYHAFMGGNNAAGAQRIMQRAVAYVTYNKENPKLLLVTDARSPNGDESDPRAGMQAAGLAFDVADYGSGIFGLLDLHTVDFHDYDAIVVASDFGGWLRQDELDVLNARSNDIAEYVNSGGGLVVFCETGSRPTEGADAGAYPGTTHDRYAFIPVPISHTPFPQKEVGFTLTEAGIAMGLTTDDINGNVSHAVFAPNGIMDVIDTNSHGRILSMAMRGRTLPTYSASGRVMAGQDPVAGVTITAGVTGRVISDPGGYYTVTGLITRTYTITPTQMCWSFTPLSRTISVPPDVTGQDFVGTPSPQCLGISGPVRGRVGTSYVFTASLASPSPSTPVTYTWQATDQALITHTAGLLDSATFAWLSPGPKTITVTAANAAGTAQAAQAVTINVPPGAVSLSGPGSCFINTPCAFTSTVTPVITTLPIVYTWEATDQLPVYHTGGLSNQATFAWASPGDRTVRVIAATEAGTVIGTRVVHIHLEPLSLSISGATSGTTGHAYVFTGSISPITATTPITYTWEATDLAAVAHIAGLNNVVGLTWNQPGPKTITVTATNARGRVSSNYTFTAHPVLYLPLMLRSAR